MSVLTKRIERIEQEVISRSRKGSVRGSIDQLQGAVNLSLSSSSDRQAIADGRWDDLSPATWQAWDAFYVHAQYDQDAIALSRRRWQAAMPSLASALDEAETPEE